ncbi:MAG: DUF4430 domain-containing protein [Ruminococcaceae bacterium]|nr:DUF4430 domain-containing protein [Oscillospiraceae bacterium]
MKLKRFISLILVIFCLVTLFSSCAPSSNKNDLWSDATYKEDKEFGSGEKTLYVKVVAEDKNVTFKIKTNAKTVGEALLEHNLVSGEKGAYGLYVKTVNGIFADYNKTKSYWAFTKNGENLTTGVDGEEFKNNDRYELVYTKQ